MYSSADIIFYLQKHPVSAFVLFLFSTMIIYLSSYFLYFDSYSLASYHQSRSHADQTNLHLDQLFVPISAVNQGKYIREKWDIDIRLMKLHWKC